MKNEEENRAELEEYTIKLFNTISDTYGNDPNAFERVLCACLATFIDIYEPREEERFELREHIFLRITKYLYNSSQYLQKKKETSNEE